MTLKSEKTQQFAKLEKLPSEFKEPAWYAIHTRSRHEAKVNGVLTGKGLFSFLPEIVMPSRRRDRHQMISVPLFPGYLFVKTELRPEHYHQIIKIAGVVRILGINGHFISVPGATIESLQKLTSSGRPYYPWQYLAKGDQVRILEGPLAGVIGTILQRDEKKSKLVISIELLGRSVAVELMNEAVEPLVRRLRGHPGKSALDTSLNITSR